jgi:LysM repeat protein
MAFWSSDAEHSNTMLSANRSHIGAAVAVSDQIYVVLETALQTRTGQNQSTANDILTNIPATQAACQGGSTIHADGSVSQYSIPVAVSTARPDGDVVHEVKYGQTLWSIAIEYGTTIEQIKRFNNLTTDAIAPGWKLLIQKGATQPAPPTSTHFISEATRTPAVPSTPTAMTSAIESPPSASGTNVFAELGQNSTVVAALIISLSVLVAGLIGFGRKREG